MSTTSTSRLQLVKPTSGTNEHVDVTAHLDNNLDSIDLNIGARICTSSTRPNPIYTGCIIFETDKNAVRIYDGTKWRLVNPIADAASVATNESTTSQTYVDLTTVGPTVTLYMMAAQRALIWVKARQTSSVGSAFMSYAVAGTETVAATDINSNENLTGAGDGSYTGPSLFVASNVEGDRTFTSKYKVGAAGTASFRNRWIQVLLLSN